MIQLAKQTILDLQKYKDYILFSTKAELKVQFSSTFLGYIWWILDPLFYMLVYVVVVRVIFQRGGPDFPIFVFCALVPWKWTVSSIVDSTKSISGKASILHQVYIPKYILPLIKNLINTVKFGFGIIVLMVMLILFGIPYTFHFGEFIPIVIVNFIFIFSISCILSHLGVFFKDIDNILVFTTRLWFYLSPALYAVESIPKSFRFLWWFNPMTTFYISYRNVFLYGLPPLYLKLGIWALVSILLLFAGLKYLYKFDKNYTKVI